MNCRKTYSQTSVFRIEASTFQVTVAEIKGINAMTLLDVKLEQQCGIPGICPNTKLCQSLLAMPVALLHLIQHLQNKQTNPSAGWWETMYLGNKILLLGWVSKNTMVEKRT